MVFCSRGMQSGPFPTCPIHPHPLYPSEPVGSLSSLRASVVPHCAVGLLRERNPFCWIIAASWHHQSLFGVNLHAHLWPLECTESSSPEQEGSRLNTTMAALIMRTGLRRARKTARLGGFWIKSMLSPCASLSQQAAQPEAFGGLLKEFPPVSAAFAYGSGVFQQAGHKPNEVCSV